MPSICAPDVILKPKLLRVALFVLLGDVARLPEAESRTVADKLVQPVPVAEVAVWVSEAARAGGTIVSPKQATSSRSTS